MKQLRSLIHQFVGMWKAISRYPTTVLFFIGAAVIISLSISQDTEKYFIYLYTFLAGAFFSLVAQALYEKRTETKPDNYIQRILFFASAIVLTIGYYIILKTTPGKTLIEGIRTGVLVFSLFIAFIWVPSIKSKFSFYETFLSSFKNFFLAVFFATIIFLGMNLIYLATNQLLFTLNEDIYGHTANIVYLLFSTTYFLSLTPEFSKEVKEGIESESLIRSITYPKFLEILFSYITIPLTSVFTIILVLYLILNIRGNFWSNNLLEPMLVSYAVTVILVTILVGGLENKFAIFFKKIFPKILVPIVVCQLIASILKIRQLGMTHGRYYVILFAAFGIFAGIVLSVKSVRKIGVVGGVLALISFISILPPVDAFTIGRNSQIEILKDILENNKMLKNGAIIPKENLSDEAKIKVTRSVQYLINFEYTDEISWLKGFSENRDFYETFGFYEANIYSANPESTSTYKYLTLNTDNTEVMSVSEYDVFAYTSVWVEGDGSSKGDIGTFEKDGATYLIKKDISSDSGELSILDEKGEVILTFDVTQIIARLGNSVSSKDTMTLEDATFLETNEKANMTVVLRSFNQDSYDGNTNLGIDMNIFIKVK